MKGEILVKKDGYDLCFIGPGGMFGEELLYKSNIYEYTCLVKSNTVTLLGL